MVKSSLLAAQNKAVFELNDLLTDINLRLSGGGSSAYHSNRSQQPKLTLTRDSNRRFICDFNEDLYVLMANFNDGALYH